MTQASEFANRIATRPDPAWQQAQIRAAIDAYRQAGRQAEAAGMLYRRLLTITDLAEHDTTEEGDR